MTKFHGFDHKQIVFLAVGVVLMFVVSLVDYHRLLDIAPWAYGVCLVVAAGGRLVGHEGAGRAAVDQPGRRRSLSAFGVGEAGADPVRWRGSSGSLGRPRADWTDIGKAFVLVGVPMAAGPERSPTSGPR